MVHSSESREDKIIIEATRAWLLASSESMTSFATDMLAPQLKMNEPESLEDYERWEGSLRKRVSRYIGGSHPFPMSFKWPWLNALPKEVRRKCLREISAIHGFLDPLHEQDKNSTCQASLAAVMQDMAEVVANSAPAHDGVYNGNDDLSQSNDMIDKLLDLAETSIAEARKINKGTGANGTRHNLAKYGKVS